MAEDQDPNQPAADPPADPLPDDVEQIQIEAPLPPEEVKYLEEVPSRAADPSAATPAAPS